MQAVRLRATAREIGPAGKLLARRPAIGAAGEGSEFLGAGLGRDWLAELEVPDGRAAQALRVGRRWPGEDKHDQSGARERRHGKLPLHGNLPVATPVAKNPRILDARPEGV